MQNTGCQWLLESRELANRAIIGFGVTTFLEAAVSPSAFGMFLRIEQIRAG